MDGGSEGGSAPRRWRGGLRLACDAPGDLLAEIGARFDEDGTAGRLEPGVWRALHEARFRGAAESGALLLDAEGDDEAGFAIARGMLAFAAAAVLGIDAASLRWTGDASGGGGLLPHFRELHVVASEEVTPRLRRVRFAGRDLARYAVGGLHVRLLLPPAGREPRWPVAGPAALPVWPDGEDRLDTRVYTIRRIDPDRGTIDMDFVLHDPPGLGCRFARGARAGDRVGILGPGGGEARRADWLVMAGDESALPAIARTLEELPEGAEGIAFVEVADEDEEQDLARPPGVELRWIRRDGRPAGFSTLLSDAVAAYRPPEGREVFLWAGAEFGAAQAIRRTARRDWALKRGSHLVVGYWRVGMADGGEG